MYVLDREGEKTSRSVQSMYLNIVKYKHIPHTERSCITFVYIFRWGQQSIYGIRGSAAGNHFSRDRVAMLPVDHTQGK